MLKALLKKQFAELFSAFRLGSDKQGKRRSTGMLVALCALMLYAVGAIVFMMWSVGDMLCAPLVQSGLGWVYFSLGGVMAFSLACVGSIFTAKSQLYEAKDNEFLLSMPIPPRTLLLTRMLALYIIAFFFCALVFAPIAVCYFTVTGFAWVPALLCVCIALLIPLAVLAVSCLLGWAIAFVTARIPAKNVFTVILLIAFFLLYSLAVAYINEWLTFILLNGEQLGTSFENPLLFVFRELGLAATGDGLAFLLFTLVCIGAFALVYILLSLTFLKTATMQRTRKKARYVERESKTRSVVFALVCKESARYMKNPMILFNCGLGSVLALVFGGFALFNTELCQVIANAPIAKGEVAVILACILCFIAASNTVTGASISLEGQNLWLLRSMPVRSTEIFFAKIAFHTAYTLLPTLPVCVLLCVLLQIPVLTSAFVTLTVAAITLLCAVVGLVVNLKFPNLKWTNEMVAVKQSLSAVLCLFAGWGIAALLVGGHFLFGVYLYAEIYMGLAVCLFIGVSAALWLWLLRRGTNVLEAL